jgi:hypothetical protein
MKKINILLLLSLLFTTANAENTTVKLNYENLNFSNSKKKDKGNRFGVFLSHKSENSLYQIAYDKTKTDTFKPPLKEDLNVDKYYLKYNYMLDNKQGISLSYATINDNLMKQTDEGNIYGIGYNYANFNLTQYFSDYAHFNVYQTDLKYVLKKSFNDIETKITFLGKYINLQDKNSNSFSKNAKDDYFTTGLKLHAHYGSYHFGAGLFLGKRVFAVMKDGFKVQHHAMEFDETYMLGLGKSFENFDLQFKYVYQNATEIPIDNKDVKVQNIIFQLGYRF